MNFDTRTVLDLISLDTALAKELEDLIVEEKTFWDKNGKTSNNDFVKSISPLVKSELKIRLIPSLAKYNLPFLSNYVDFDKVDYFHLIPAIAKFT